MAQVLVNNLADEIFSRFDILSRISLGRYSRVYVAHDRLTDQLVALKVFDKALSEDKIFLRSFAQEASIWVTLDSPYVTKVLDWSIVGSPYLVLELKEGGSLRSVLDRGKLSLQDAVSVAIDVAHGISYLHQHGVIHGDVKPSNILFDKEKNAAVTDFGLSKAFAQVSQTEPAGLAPASYLYCAPEIVKGSDLNFRTDVYSLALVLFEAICGYVPFLKDSAVATLTARLEDSLPDDPSLQFVKPLLDKATIKDPQQRISIEHFREQAQDLVKEQKVERSFELCPIEIKDSTGKGKDFSVQLPKKRSKPIRNIIVATLSLVLLLVLAIGYFFYNKYVVYQSVVPNLTGLNKSQVATELKAQRLKALFKNSFSNKVPNGYVIEFSPSANTREKPGSVVKVVISKGKFPIKIPLISNILPQNYINELKSDGFAVQVSYQYSNSIEKGEIISVSPNPGVFLQPGNSVVVVISNGPAPVKIPSIGNLTASAYQSLIASLGLKAQLIHSYSNSIPAGDIISVSPPVGSLVSVGTYVQVNISLGPQMVKVPNVIGFTIDQAYKAITQAGLSFAGAYGPGDTVLYTSPAPGSIVKVGTSVTVFS